jgi:predicted CXXCH cytochrome family protein
MFATLFLALTISGVSADCRACHDGSKAQKMGTGHVVEMEYAQARAAKPDFFRLPDAPSGLGATVAEDMLVSGRVECTSCHVPHETETGRRYRLRAEILPLCRSCHILQ